MNDKFNIEYNKWLRQLPVVEDDSVWKEIEGELDFVETWDNVSGRLDEIAAERRKVVAIRNIKIVAAAAAIILLIFIPVKIIMDTNVQLPVISEEIGVEEESVRQTPDELQLYGQGESVAGLTDTIGEPALPVVTTNITQLPIATGDSGQALTAKPVHDEKDILVFGEERRMPASINVRTADAERVVYNSVNELRDLISDEPVRIADAGASESRFVRIEEIGLMLGYKNTWLLNYETFNGLNPKKLGNTLPTFNHDLGFSTTLDFKESVLIGIEFLWKSGAGQNYQQYINASFMNREIGLNYLRLQTFYKRENSLIPGGSLILGGYIANLSYAEERVGEEVFKIEERYRNFDYGLLAGYQIAIPLKGRFIIEPGMRLNYNLVNIFLGDDIIPGSYKDSRNFEASFTLSFAYKLF